MHPAPHFGDWVPENERSDDEYYSDDSNYSGSDGSYSDYSGSDEDGDGGGGRGGRGEPHLVPLWDTQGEQVDVRRRRRLCAQCLHDFVGSSLSMFADTC